MAMEEKDQVDTQSGGEAADAQEQSAPGPSANAESKAEDRNSRMSAAKAFYRAMYAGEEVNPDDFGIQLAEGGGSAPAQTGPRGECMSCKSLEAHVAELEAKVAETEGLYKRMAADFENYRRRMDREREEFAGTGMMRALEGILPALDDLDRAQGSLNEAMEPKAMLESLSLVYNRFARCLEGLGAKAMEVIGQPFDPRLHEPVQEIPTNDYPDGTVVHELRRGYMFKDRILRPALVNVSARTQEEPPQPAAQESEPAPEESQVREAAAAAEEATPEAAPEQPSEQSVGQALQNLVQPQKKESGRRNAEELTKDLHQKPTSTQDLPIVNIDERLLEQEITPSEDFGSDSAAEPEAADDGQVYDIGDADEKGSEYAEMQSGTRVKDE
ncbi:MAG TPA: nucleotide exchange factor GrpE [Candidatus Obscuribacterales bacterium]